MSIYELIDKLIEREGGYVNDPDDSGGETKYGIAKRYYPDLDIYNLTKDQARQIYFDDYYVKNKVAMLPDHLREIYFDMTVHMGYRCAVRILQQSINNHILIFKKPYN